MRVAYTTEHLAFKKAADDFAQRYVEPLLQEIDFDEHLSATEYELIWERLRGRGIVDEAPRDADGSVDWIAVGILIEAIATRDASLAFMVTETVVLPELYQLIMTPEQRDFYAHLFGNGKHFAGAFSEADAGSNPGEIATTARRTPEGWRIEGTKIWTSGAANADAFLVSCRVIDEDGDSGIIAPFLVEPSISPVEVNPIEMLGLRGHSVAEVVLRAVDVPAIAMLGADGNGLALIGSTLRKARCMMGVISVGIAQHALDLALEYAKERKQFGRPIASFQLVQDLLVDMATEVNLARLMTFRALTLLHEGEDATIESSMAKAYATEAVARVTSKAIQVHGGIGLTKELVLERLFRDARMMSIPDGTTQIQTLIIGRALTGISALR